MAEVAVFLRGHLRNTLSSLYVMSVETVTTSEYEQTCRLFGSDSTLWVRVIVQNFNIHNIPDDSTLSFTGRSLFYISLTARQHKAKLLKQLSRHGRKLTLRIP
jgi:hypothetical protein